MMRPVLTIARYSFLEAINSKLIYIFFSLFITACSIGLFVGEITLTETSEAQVALMAGFIRTAAILTMVLYVVSSIARDFQDKTIELLFSTNITRTKIFLGKYLCFVFIALFVSCWFAMGLSFFGDIAASFIWSLALFFELCLVSLIAFIFIVSLEHITLSISVTIGVYMLARVMPVIQSIGDGPFNEDISSKIINSVIDVIDLILPRFADYSAVSWLTSASYTSESILLLLAESLLYIVFLLSVGIYDLKRKKL